MLPEEIVLHESVDLHRLSSVEAVPPETEQVSVNVVVVLPDIGETEAVTEILGGVVTTTGVLTLFIVVPLTRHPGV